MSAPLKFEILDELGHGQFSTVYRAKWIDPPPLAEVDAGSSQEGASYHVNGGATFIDKYTQRRNAALATTRLDGNQLPQRRHATDNTTSPATNTNTNTTTTSSFNNNGCNIELLAGNDLTPNQRQDAQSATATTMTTKTTERCNERYVALKRIKFYDIQNASTRMDYLKEVKLLQQVKHPNIINFNISFIERNELFIVLELADGGDLSKLIRYFQKKKRLIPEQMILKYFTQVCSAVEYIHSKRILHRDIKPANIFMTSDGCVKLGDFGLGRFFSQNTRDAHSIVGTFYYMSPERIRETGYSFSSDVWSLGCVLYELITLNSPFSILNHEQNLAAQQQNTNPYNLQWLINRIIAAEYPSLDGYKNISPRLRDLTTECLNPNQEARPDMRYICAVVNGLRAAAATNHRHQ